MRVLNTKHDNNNKKKNMFQIFLINGVIFTYLGKWNHFEKKKNNKIPHFTSNFVGNLILVLKIKEKAKKKKELIARL